MQHTGAAEVGLLALFLGGIVFAWDGLARRHVRLTRDLINLQVDIRGVPAILPGILGVGLLLFAGTTSVVQLWVIARQCDGSAVCLWHSLVVPPFTSWSSVLVLVMVVAAFALWARGASNLSGPYRWRWLAPGVCEDEGVLVERVRADLDAAHLAPVDTDVMTRAITWVRRNVGLTTLKVRSTGTQEQPINSHLIFQLMRADKNSPSSQVSDEQAYVMLRVMVNYYADLHTRAARAYLWKRHRRPTRIR